MKLRIVLLCSLALVVSGCARNIDSGTYTASHVGEASRSFRGVITHVRPVVVEGSENLQDNTLGIVAGGAGGALAGSAFGGGRGQIATALLGAAAGATAGAFAEKALKKQNALEYTVELEGGELRTVVQGPKPAMSVGQPVLLMVSHGGRSRITPDHSGRHFR